MSTKTGNNGWLNQTFGLNLILLTVAAALAYHYLFFIGIPEVLTRMKEHELIVTGLAPAPFTYRVLIPYLASVILAILSKVIPYQHAFIGLYGIIDFAGIYLILWTLYRYLRGWFDESVSLVGSLFCAATMVIALRDHAFSPWSFYETGFIGLALIWIREKKFAHLYWLIPVAALNRETAVLIPLLYLATQWDTESQKQVLTKGMIFLGLWCIIFVGLRVFLGNHANIIEASELMRLNFSPGNIIRTIVKVTVFFGIFIYAGIAGLRYSPQFLKRTWRVLPLYLSLYLVFGAWKEMRLLMPLYYFLIPAGLFYWFKGSSDNPTRTMQNPSAK